MVSVTAFQPYFVAHSLSISLQVLGMITMSSDIMEWSLTFSLTQQKNKTGFAVTDDLVSRISRRESDLSLARQGKLQATDLLFAPFLVVTIQTGIITAVWATMGLAIFVSSSVNWLHVSIKFGD